MQSTQKIAPCGTQFLRKCVKKIENFVTNCTNGCKAILKIFDKNVKNYLQNKIAFVKIQIYRRNRCIFSEYTVRL